MVAVLDKVLGLGFAPRRVVVLVLHAFADRKRRNAHAAKTEMV